MAFFPCGHAMAKGRSVTVTRVAVPGVGGTTSRPFTWAVQVLPSWKTSPLPAGRRATRTYCGEPVDLAGASIGRLTLPRVARIR